MRISKYQCRKKMERNFNFIPTINHVALQTDPNQKEQSRLSKKEKRRGRGKKHSLELLLLNEQMNDCMFYLRIHYANVYFIFSSFFPSPPSLFSSSSTLCRISLSPSLSKTGDKSKTKTRNSTHITHIILMPYIRCNQNQWHLSM